MRQHLAAVVLAVAMLASLGLSGPARADGGRTSYVPYAHRTTSDVQWGDGVRFVWRQRFHGPPVYRCRRFSSRCSYIWPTAYYRQYVSFRFVPGTGDRRGHTHRPGRLVADTGSVPSVEAPRPAPSGGYRYGGQKVTVLDWSGGFARIEAPGNAARWVRADDLQPEK